VFSLDAILLLLLLDPGSGATAFASIINLCTFGFQTSYGFPILLKLIYQPKTFPKTSFDLGRWSRPFGIVSVVWLSFSTILLLCPTSFPYTKDNFNYLIVLVTGIFILMTINWYYNSQYIFTGPKQTHEVEEDKVNNVRLILHIPKLSNSNSNSNSIIKA
jgi:amino acid transporter